MSTPHPRPSSSDSPKPEQPNGTDVKVDSTLAHAGATVADADAIEDSAPAGYVLLDELGRGGMGVVYRARDLSLDREVAVKVLSRRFEANSAAAHRFLDEGRITGQLQHPGIPPVHQVGALPDGRPFLAMKLIKGQTLATLMKSNRKLESLSSLAIFESVCQAVGYAHAHRVIHRDLKPANIMVGAFGEVQVMDWGLAKVLSDGPGRSAIAPPTEVLATEIRSVRELDGSYTLAGSVMGTPAFMSPEQAAGEIDKVDQRSDVFSLGAILCDLLTGHPPFRGKDADSIRLNAIRGNLTDAFERLDACVAEPELVHLAKSCLAFDPKDRPASAGIVADEVHALRAAADDRAKKAEVEKARAEVRSLELRKRRRVQVALVGSVVLLAIGAAAAGWWHVSSRAAAEAIRQARETATVASVSAALDDAKERMNESWKLADDPEAMNTRAEMAVAALRRAEGFAATGEPTEELNRQISVVNQDVEELIRHSSCSLSIELAIEGHADSNYDGRQTCRQIRSAFAKFGIDPDATSETDAVQRLLESRLRDRFLGYLCDWHFQARAHFPKEHVWLGRVISHARNQAGGLLAEWQESLSTGNASRLSGFSKLDDALTLGPQLLCALGRDLRDTRQPTARLLLLRRAVLRYPQYVWLRYDLADACEKSLVPEYMEQLQQLAAIAALRPNSASFKLDLAATLFNRGEFDRAIEVYHEALRMRPNHMQTRNALGNALLIKGRTKEAVAEYRKAIQVAPSDSVLHENLAVALAKMRNYEEAHSEFKIAIKLDPKNSSARTGIVEPLRVLVARNPKNTYLRAELADRLTAVGMPEQALSEYRELMRADPKNSVVLAGLEKALRQMTVKFPKSVKHRVDLGVHLLNQGHADRAATEFEAASKIDPKAASPFIGMARAHLAADRPKVAMLAYKRALTIQPTGDTALEIAKYHFDRGEPLTSLSVIEPFTKNPTAKNDSPIDIRFVAACCAALAAESKNTPADIDRAVLRRKALDWLIRERDACAKIADAEPDSKDAVHEKMSRWLGEPNLASVRDAIANLPEGERAGWTEFWASVRNLRDATAAKNDT